MTVTLAARLRAETSALHAQAEQTPFMADLIGGRLDRRAYCLMLRNLEPVYRAMEGGLAAHARQPDVAPIIEPALFRTSALRQDLQFLHGRSWEHELALLPSGLAYEQRLLAIAQASPGLLAAHAYVRYLGDLSGGQMLRDITSLSLGLGPGRRGMEFYEFGDAAAVRGLTQALRAGLNQVALTQAGQDAIVAEAKWAFETHCTLFAELAQACAKAPPRVTPLQ